MPSSLQAGARQVDVTVGSAGSSLPGTLVLPRGPGPFPALVLVAGSGPQDRDETIGPNKTFRDLAWGLASRGIAVLRYEKRNHVHGEKMVKLIRDRISIPLIADIHYDYRMALACLEAVTSR